MRKVLGLDLYNGAITGGAAMAICGARADPHKIPCVLVYESHGQDSRYKPMGEVCETVSQKYGTGGATPLSF